MKNSKQLYKITAKTEQGETVTAFVFAKNVFNAAAVLQSNLQMKLTTCKVLREPIQFDVWKNV